MTNWKPNRQLLIVLTGLMLCVLFSLVGCASTPQLDGPLSTGWKEPTPEMVAAMEEILKQSYGIK